MAGVLFRNDNWKIKVSSSLVTKKGSINIGVDQVINNVYYAPAPVLVGHQLSHSMTLFCLKTSNF